MELNGLLARFSATDCRNAKRLALIAGSAFVGTFFVLGIAGVRINASPSLPIGLYVLTNDTTAALVEFCPPEPYASLAIRRGYRKKGICHDGATPLLKAVVAAEGDIVELSSRGISVNGRIVPNTQPRATDTAGRPMPVWPTILQRVEPRTVWVASNFSSRSFDSRYFGPISISSIRNRLRPLVTE